MEFETERLLVRTPRPSDAIDLLNATRASISRLRMFPASLPWALGEPDEASTQLYIQKALETTVQKKDFPLIFISKGNVSIAGCGGVHRPNFRAGKFEIGFWGNVSHSGKGCITEAVQGIVRRLSHAYSAHRIEALIDDRNLPAIAVCERSGFELEGILRNERMDPDGKLRHTRVYSVVLANSTSQPQQQ
ncbi:GNAT family N-acetyltransferase [Burkholderia ubonensis]|uniref:GNAT family N-acetyltransferase n=1 Tax=Burkholderia ubonensis TaxID=101571 RepID=UPI0009B4718B|nr:GNAT family protein [Burkholderia ubonensis]